MARRHHLLLLVIRILLASPLGLLIGLSLGALGGGGSILAVPALVYAAGQDPKQATVSSLLLVGAASAVGLIGHYRAGRVAVDTGVAFGLAGIGGALAGAAVNRRLDSNVLLLAFAGLVVIAAWRMITGCPTCTRVGETTALTLAGGREPTGFRIDARTTTTLLLAGTAVGFLTGLFGVGGGFVIVPALALGLKLPMPKAIGTSLLVITINSAVTLTTRLPATSINWGITVPFTIAAIVGVVTGGKIANRLNPTRSLRAFATLLIAVAAYTAGRAGVALNH